MIKHLLIGLLLLSSFSLWAQDKTTPKETARSATTIGILQGGGGLVGVDFECLLGDRVGFQVGAGIFSFGAGVNIHIEPSIRSSFFSLQYWNQGVGEDFVQSAIGPSFVFRGKKWLTAQIGFGKVIERANDLPKKYKETDYMLLYSIGVYIPLK